GAVGARRASRGIVPRCARLPPLAPLRTGRVADLYESAVRGVIDLERCVVDVEAFGEHPLQFTTDGVAIVALVPEHVGGEGRETARDLPDVQVVDVLDGRVRGEGASDFLGVEAFGGRLEQDTAGVAQQAPGRVDHHAGDDEGRDAVGARPAGG